MPDEDVLGIFGGCGWTLFYLIFPRELAADIVVFESSECRNFFVVEFYRYLMLFGDF